MQLTSVTKLFPVIKNGAEISMTMNCRTSTDHLWCIVLLHDKEDCQWINMHPGNAEFKVSLTPRKVPLQVQFLFIDHTFRQSA